MFLRYTLALTLLAMLASPAYAFRCPADAAEIDRALDSMELPEEKRAEVQQLRDEGMTLHDEGNHQAAVDKLSEAMQLLRAEE